MAWHSSAVCTVGDTPQLLAQDSLNGLNLAQCGGLLTRPCIQAHQAAMRCLVQGVQSQPPLRIGDPPLHITLRRAPLRQSLQRARQFAPQGLGLEGLPVIELGAIPQGEAIQEVTAVEIHRLTEQGRAVRADLADRMTMDPTLSQEVAEPNDVHGLSLAAIQPDGLPARYQPRTA